MLFRVFIAALFLSPLAFAPPEKRVFSNGNCHITVVTTKGNVVNLGVHAPQATPIDNPYANFNQWGLDPTNMVERMKHGNDYGAYVRMRASYDLLITETGLMREYKVVRVRLSNSAAPPPPVEPFFAGPKKILLAIEVSPTKETIKPEIVHWLDEVSANVALGKGKVLLFDGSADCEFSTSIATYLNLGDRPDVDVDLERKMTP